MFTLRQAHTTPVAPRPARLNRSAGWAAEAIAYLISGLLCCAALAWVYQLRHANLSVPIHYENGGDLTLECMLVKGIVQNGWYLHNPHLGAPGEQDLRDLPMPDLVTLAPMKIMSWFTSSWGAIINLYFFAGFLLGTWSALAVMRHFGVARAPAVLAALLFSFAPYHFLRGEWHLHLSAYFVIPLGALLMLWVMSGEPLFRLRRVRRFLIFPVPSRKGVLSVGACVLLGSDGAYYAFFTILLLVCAGLYGALESRSVRRLASAALLIALIGATTVLSLMPDIVHIVKDGKNTAVAIRAPSAAELYGLRLTQLVMPIAGHRIQRLADFRTTYNRSLPPAAIGSESAELGAFCTAGFILLILGLVTGYPWNRGRELIHRLGVLNLSAFLIGTLGGIGSLVAWTIWSQFRAYNRISIFIAFFAAMAIAVLMDELWRKWAGNTIRRCAFGAALCAILLGGLLDQASPAWTPPYKLFEAQYRNDRDFTTRAERWLPAGSMVLELPFVPFPETPPSGSMVTYDPLIPYLHSTSLRWSYGNMKGRYWSAWEAHLASLPFAEMMNAAAAAGFRAIFVDRNGYADQGANIGSKLGSLELPHIESTNGRFRLYNIQPYVARIEAEHGPEAWARMRENVLHPIVLQWLPECSAMEGDMEKNWHWCGSHGTILLENPLPHSQRIDLRGALVSGWGNGCDLRIDGPDWRETIRLNRDPHPFIHSMEVAPGKSAIAFNSNCQPLPAPQDTRSLVFRIDDFSATLTGSPLPELSFGAGFYAREETAGRSWRWCAATGEIVVRNTGPAAEIVIRTILKSAQQTPTPVSIRGPGFTDSVTVGPAGDTYARRFVAAHGDSTITFSSQPAPPPSGSPKPVLRVEDLQLENPALAPTVIVN